MAELWHIVQSPSLRRCPALSRRPRRIRLFCAASDLEAGQPSVQMVVAGEAPRPVAASGLRSFITPGFSTHWAFLSWLGVISLERDTETAPRMAILNE